MIFRNIEFHNVSELTQDSDGSYILHRFPVSVENAMEGSGAVQNRVAVGVELRFRIGSGAVKLRLRNAGAVGTAARVHQYRGEILDQWQNYVYTLPGGEEREIVIEPHREPELLGRVSTAAGHAISPDVVRLALNSSSVRFVGISGDVLPPRVEDLPKRTYLAYGSSITNGSHSYSDAVHFVTRVAEHFHADRRNLGLAGNARLEREVADEIAAMGERGEWDFATLCLGINISGIPREEFRRKVRYMLLCVTEKNPDKHVFAISPIYSKDDMLGKSNLDRFREVVAEEVARIGTENLHYVSGLELLGGAHGLSGDFVHPTPNGADEIAKNLIQAISKYVK